MVDSMDAGPPPAPPPSSSPPAVPRSRTLGKTAMAVAVGVVGVIAMINGATQLYRAMQPTLPGCAAASTNAAIHDIFKKKNVELTSLTDMKSITSTASERTCQASFRTQSEAGTISYRISSQGDSANVLITNVDTHAVDAANPK